MKLSQIEKEAFFIFNFSFLILFVISILAGNDSNRRIENKLCLKYAAKKCNVYDKDKIQAICNTLAIHNRSIVSVKNYYSCYKKD